MDRIRLIARRYVWWMALSMAVALAIGIALGLAPLLLLCAALNTAGAAFYLSGVRRNSRPVRRRWNILVPLTVLQLPVGIVGVFAPRSSVSPPDSIVGDPDDRDNGGVGVWTEPHPHSCY